MKLDHDLDPPQTGEAPQMGCQFHIAIPGQQRPHTGPPSPGHPGTVAAIFWGAVNWLLDAAALWVLLAAFGYRADPGQLLLVYGLVGILSLVPITPGGLGIVEGVMVPLLVALGSTSQIAILGVIAWRLLQFWMPMPLGAVSALSLLARPRLRRETA